MVTDPAVGIKHAFVTGATGIVGVPLCRELVAIGAKVTAYSRSSGEYGLPASVEHSIGSILDADVMTAAAGDADVIFHVAAAVHGSVSTYAEFERMNVDGTANVIRVAREIGAKLVYVSSVNVAGFRAGDLADSYAETKSKAEELIAEAVGDGLDAMVVRPATVFGNEAGRAGLIVDRLLAGTLKFLPAPSRKISPVWSVDLGRALIGAALFGEAGRVYTVAGPTLSTGEFVRSVWQSGGLKGPVIMIPGWIFAVPLQLAWWAKGVTRWTPPVSVESLLSGSSHDGSEAARELGFEYSTIDKIFGS
jgi:dihydroflavonol-4-reductase